MEAESAQNLSNNRGNGVRQRANSSGVLSHFHVGLNPEASDLEVSDEARRRWLLFDFSYLLYKCRTLNLKFNLHLG